MDEAPQALFGHTCRVWREMEDQAQLLPAEGSHMLVYEGKLTELITQDVGLSVPYYTKVTQALKGMGCAIQLQRGGGTSPSKWELVKEPTLELFNKWVEDNSEVVELPEYATVQQLHDVNRRLQRVERALGTTQ